MTGEIAKDIFYKAVARKFHDVYERLAPDFGYETRPDTRRFDPESPNGKLMIAVVREVVEPDIRHLDQTNARLQEEKESLIAERDHALNRRRETSRILKTWQNHCDRVAKILGCFGMQDAVEDAAQNLIAERDRLREALEGYADENAWEGERECEWKVAYGYRLAQAALKGSDK